MPTLSGPCTHCGTPVTRYVRPGKVLLCLECAIEKQSAHNRAMAYGTSPMLERSAWAGVTSGEQIRARSGPAYDKWVRGMKAYIDTQDITTSPNSDTLGVTTPPRKGRKRKE